jgi:hypothetical protein
MTASWPFEIWGSHGQDQQPQSPCSCVVQRFVGNEALCGSHTARTTSCVADAMDAAAGQLEHRQCKTSERFDACLVPGSAAVCPSGASPTSQAPATQRSLIARGLFDGAFANFRMACIVEQGVRKCVHRVGLPPGQVGHATSSPRSDSARPWRSSLIDAAAAASRSAAYGTRRDHPSSSAAMRCSLAGCVLEVWCHNPRVEKEGMPAL